MNRFYGHPDDPANTNPPDMTDEEMDELEIEAGEDKYQSDKEESANEKG